MIDMLVLRCECSCTFSAETGVRIDKCIVCEAADELDALREAAKRAEQKLSAYVGVCPGDKELTDAVLPMLRAALK